MYSFALYNSYQAYGDMRTYCRRDNVSKIFLDVQTAVRKEIALSRSTMIDEIHVAKIWGNGVVKLFEVKLKKDNPKVSLRAL